MRIIVYKILIAAALFAVAFQAALAEAPVGFTTFSEKGEILTIEGRDATLRYTPAADLSAAAFGRFHNVPLYVDGDLREVTTALTAALSRSFIDEECGDRLRAHSLRLRPQGEVAVLEGTLKYELWHCVKTKVPEFRGLKVEMKMRTISKTRLLQQSARLCIEIAPRLGDDGRSLRLSGRVTCAEPSKGSLLGRLNSLLNLDGALMRTAQDALDDLNNEDAVLTFPPELERFEPKLETVFFKEREDGGLGFEATGSASVPISKWLELLRILGGK